MKFSLKYTGIILSVNVLLAVAVFAQEGKISGKVKDGKGNSIEAALIIAYLEPTAGIKTKDQAKEKKAEVKSDKKGHFEIPKLSPGFYSLTLEKQGYKTFFSKKIEISAGQTTQLRQAAVLHKEDDPYSVIHGAVLNGNGFSLRNAEVTIERIDGGKKFKDETVSHEAGEFAFRVKSEKAKYRITAKANGYAPTSIEIDVTEDEIRNIVLTLK